MREDTIRIRFDFGVNSLYDLGYFSVDIYHLIVFCELLEKEYENSQFLEEIFFSPSWGFRLTRNAKVLREFRHKAKIVHLQDGSIELVIAGIGAIASIVVPIMLHLVQEKSRRSDERIIFEVNSDDYEVNRLIDEVQKGYYGFDEAGVEWLLDTLSRWNYDVRVQSKDVYKISKVLQGIERRMVRTIPKYTKK
ncbi:hypothetical protein AXX12_18505 [Anaerosporomusa subterranea]|uniref:Uncharacterized protein n=1 Tax=Anaerosporomusa subterranea TaxID=1794912 RepID=A0A154BSQ1_ANASB|nr:hypothetical protein [Anaerosporomusa subterranea]KYZ76895.1 hypothetical protein AXX12_18505 [Anaerosporomusa subterranea]